MVEISKEQAIFALIFLLFVFSLFMVKMYADVNHKLKTEERLTYQKALNMSYLEILTYLAEREAMRQEAHIRDLIPLVGIIGFLTGAVAVILLQKSKEGPRNEIIELFPKDYRTVIKILIDKRGEASQAYIGKILGLNKVKASRLIRKMEEEGYLRVIRGHTNLVELSPRVKNILEKCGFKF